MQWLNSVVEDIAAAQPEGEVLVESGVSPSGTYHLGTLREVLTAEVIVRELKRRGRSARHIHFVDDLDALRKIPADIPPSFEKYLGQPLSKVPAPNGAQISYADYFLEDLLKASKELKLEMEVVRSHQRYQAGFFTPAIEQALERVDTVRKILETISGHKLGEEWSPIQVDEDGYLKKRRFVSLDKAGQNITYEDKDGQQQTTGYAKGEVKLDWRIDWPARWWLLKVDVEPFGRDHATKGGSYDTGAALIRQVYGAEPPLPLPYAFINRAGQTKKMSKSAGDTINLASLLQILPPEAVWFFVIRYAPAKQLFFDEGEGVVRLIDEFAALLAKETKTAEDKQLIALCTQGLKTTISHIPFSHLVASYQAALKDPTKTLEILGRTEYSKVVEKQAEIIKKELAFIDSWLKDWAPEELKFELLDNVSADDFREPEKQLLASLADKLEKAPPNADGEWFHKAIYELKETGKLTPQQVFEPLYRALIGQKSGPRAGWFLSMLPRDWLVKRLRLEE